MAVSDFTDKITPQHRDKPRFVATVAETVRPLDDETTFLKALPLAFDIDTAVGAQLDVVGEWVGRSRYIPTPLDDLWFAFDNAPKGFDKGIWKGPYATGIGFTRLDDPFYRALLKAKVLCNAWDGTVAQARVILTTFLGGLTRAFFEDRTRAIGQTNGAANAASSDQRAFINIAGRLPPRIATFILGENLLPLKPCGVRTYYFMTSVDGASMFGFDVNSDFVGGFDRGAWGIPMDRPDLIAA